MKHNLLSLFFAAIAAMNMYATDVWDGSSDIFTHGAGTEQSPYLIENAEQLAFIAEMVNAGIYTYSGNYFKLTTDLNLNNLAWVPIGDATHMFGGNFDGDGHTISNLKITAATTNAGLFGVVSGGVYKNITIQGAITSSANATNAGGLIGYATAACTIDSCTNNVTIGELNKCVGGIIGRGVNVSFSNCINNTWLTGKEYVGGIIGLCENTSKVLVVNCINYGEISITSSKNNCFVGGIAGQMTFAEMRGVINMGKIECTLSTMMSSTTSQWYDRWTTSTYMVTNECNIDVQIYVGGIVGGASKVKVFGSINYGDINGTSIITGSYNYNRLEGNSAISEKYSIKNKCCVGGICGEFSDEEILQSCNSGRVKSNLVTPSCPYGVGGGYWRDNYGNVDWSNANQWNYLLGNEKKVNSASISNDEGVGGIVGQSSSVTLYACLNKGSVQGASSGAGLMGGSASNSTISYCANTGDAKAQGISTRANVYCSYSASSIGDIGISSGTVTNSYYINGSGNGTQKTDAQMKSVTLPILLNADSTVFIQDVKPYVNKGYPIFKNGMKYVATNEASDVSYTSATIQGYYYNCNPTSMGFVYKEENAEDYIYQTVSNASPAQYELTNLTQGTTYVARYWLIDDGIKYYGDTIHFTTLACPTKPVRSDTVTLCQGESYEFAGKTLTLAGTYHDSLVATTGCDSIIELVLQITDTYKYPKTETIERGESYDFYGQLLTEPGVYSEYIRTTNRCNWIELTLIVHEPDKTLTLNVNNPLWGSVIGAGTFEHGTVAEFSAVPAEGCYFVNWSDGETNAVRAIALTKDTIITANFAIHQFTITTEATNGSVSGGGTYNYGTQVTLTATADEHYHFVRWNDGNTEATRQITVTENKIYSAVFELDKFLVTFRNADGTELKSDEVEYGAMPVAPADPTKESTAQYDYTFAGWTPTITIVTQAATYTATYTPVLREYLVTFLNEDNTVISSKNYKYGETPVAPADPVKQNTAEYTYTFNGWDNAIAQVQGPQTYKATYTATKNSYTITWQNEDGSLIDQEAVEYGVVPTHAEPTKQATAEYTYTFAGWTPAVVAVTGNATYKATFNATKNKYLITFRDENGTELKSEEVEYGVMPIAPTDPTKESTAQYDYTFAGWTPAVAIVTQAATYTATYTSALREYLVTFLNEDNTVISSKNYKYGETPIAPADPVKQNTAEYTYTFNGWDNAIDQVQGPQTYKATYTATKNSYTITWQNEDGSLVDQTTVEYGVVPTHAEPTKQATAEYTYTFAGWTPVVVAVTGDATYKATFTATKNSYTITWQNEDGSLIDQTTVEYGQIPTHADPIKLNTAVYTYTFAGWTPAVVAVTGDATYKATFTATKNSYTITWQNEDGSLIDQTTVEYGVVPTHTDPIKQNTAEYTYTFAGWTPAVVAVSGDATYKATFTATKNSYTITWQNEDGSLIDQTTVEYGVVPTHAEPTKQATAEYTYTFAGWTPAVVAVTGDATYKATFSSVVNVYTISVSAANGQVIGGGEYQYGATIDLTAIPNEGYVFDQWSDGVKDNPRTITITGDAEYTALFTSTEGFENIYTSEPVQKVIIDQKVYILRGEKVYTLTGAEVK